MWNGKSISVILPTYNEKDSIRESILDFFATGIVDEVIVVNNNAAAGTSEEVQGTGAREVLESRQGYGAAIRRGFQEATGDYLVVCEPDDTFIEQDIFKLLAYAADHEIVFGSRTVKEFIWSGANMGAFLRWGNYAVAKLMEVLFNTNSLSDVGCTFRLVSRSALEKMQPYFRIYDNYFGPEMMLLAARLDIPFVQIPLNYKSRIGESSVTGDFFKAFSLGMQMIFMIFAHRMEGSLKFSPVSSQKKNIGDVFLTYRYYFFCLALFTVFTFWIKKPLSEYLTGDASLFIVLVHSVLGLINTPLIDLQSGRDIWHPFLYQSLLILTGKIFGPELLKLRLIGLVCLVIDLYLIRKIANLLVDNQREGRVLTFLAYLLFLLIPLTIDGALHIDIDNTVMTPLLLAFFVFFIRYEQAENKQTARHALLMLMLVIMPLMLWSKLTTPLAVPAAVGLYYLIKKQIVKALALPILLLIVGGGIFMVTWYLFCYYFNLPFLWVFERYVMLTSSTAGTSATSGFMYHIRQIAMIAFWFNTTMVLLWLGCVFSVIRKSLLGKAIAAPLLFAVVLSVIAGMVYLFIGAISFGLAKYHFPLTALIAIIIAYCTYPLLDKLSIRTAVLSIPIILVVAIVYFFVEDPLYLLTRGLKLQAIENLSFQPVLIRLFIIFIFYLLPCVAGLFFVMKSKFRQASGILILLALAQMIGFNFHKSLSDYHTAHGYGYYGAAETYKKISSAKSVCFSEGMIIEPYGPLPTYRVDQAKYLNTSEKFKAYIAKSQPDAVVFGAPFDMISQMQNVYVKPEFHAFMQQSYKLDSIGDYYIYFKKEHPKP